MKKLYLFFVVVLITTMLAACGGSAAAPIEAEAPTEAPAVNEPAATEAPAASASGYVLVTDDTGAVEVSIPAEWDQINGSVVEFIETPAGERISGASIFASSDAENFMAGAPGIQIIASDRLAELGGYIQVLDFWKTTFTASPYNCAYDSDRTDYTDSKYEGKLDYFTGCNGVDGQLLVVFVVRPIDEKADHLITLLINYVDDTETGMEQVTTILDSFNVVGELP